VARRPIVSAVPVPCCVPNAGHGVEHGSRTRSVAWAAWAYLESQDFWLDEVDGRAIDFDEALAGLAVGYCGGSLRVSNGIVVWERTFFLPKVCTASAIVGGGRGG